MTYSGQGQTAAGRYAQLESARSTFDREAKESSKLTIPSLIPESTTGTRSKIKTPFQAVGARGVNSLASKFYLHYYPHQLHFLS